MIPHANKKVGDLTIKEFETVLKYFCLLKDTEKLYQGIKRTNKMVQESLYEVR